MVLILPSHPAECAKITEFNVNNKTFYGTAKTPYILGSAVAPLHTPIGDGVYVNVTKVSQGQPKLLLVQRLHWIYQADKYEVYL